MSFQNGVGKEFVGRELILKWLAFKIPAGILDKVLELRTEILIETGVEEVGGIGGRRAGVQTLVVGVSGIRGGEGFGE